MKKLKNILWPLAISMSMLAAIFFVTPASAANGSPQTGGWWTDFTDPVENEIWNLLGTESGIDSQGLYSDWDAGTEALIALYHPGGDFVLGAKPTYYQGLGSTTYMRAGIFPYDDFLYHSDGGSAWWGTCNTESLFSKAAANEYREKICVDLPEGYYVLRVKTQGSLRRHMRELHLSSTVVFPYPGDFPEPPGPITAVPITSTCEIQSTGGISGAVPTTIVVPANLLQNPGFESGELTPDNWTVQSLYAPSYYQTDPSRAFEGVRYLEADTLPPVRFTQAISMPESPGYMMGAMIDYEYGSPWPMRLGLEQLTITPTAQALYIPQETVVTTYGNLNYLFDLPDTQSFGANAPVRLDYAYLIPVETDPFGAVIGVYCPAVEEYYNQNPTAVPTSTTTQLYYGLPLPVTGAGTVCYTCNFPYGAGVEAAVAWLGCVIRNLFACDLRFWLDNINNSVLGVFGAVSSLSFWMATTTQNGVNWSVDGINRTLDATNQMYSNISGQLAIVTVDGGGGSEMSPFAWLYALLELIPRTIESIANVLTSFLNLGSAAISLVASLIYLILNLIRLLSEPLIAIVGLLQGVIEAFVIALSSEPLTFPEFTSLSGGTIATDTTTTDGLGFLAFMWGIALVDRMIVDGGVYWLVWIAAGIVGFSTLLWLFSIWDLGEYVG